MRFRDLHPNLYAAMRMVRYTVHCYRSAWRNLWTTPRSEKRRARLPVTPELLQQLGLRKPPQPLPPHRARVQDMPELWSKRR